jgi:hypothetical protein
MKLVALAAAGFVAASTPASAQFVPRPMAPIGPSSAQDATEIVEAMGLHPIGVPARIGAFYVQSARDDLGRVLHVTVDARRSQVVAVATGAPHALYGPDAGYVPQYPLHRGPAAYPGQGFDIAPPGSIMGARVTPNGAAPPATMPPGAQPKPMAKSAAVTPKEPPVPRKRPASAPQQAAGSVEPVAAPQAAAPVAEKPAATTPPPAPEKPANAMPPVSPLE